MEYNSLLLDDQGKIVPREYRNALILVLFHADYCSHCKKFLPVYKEFSSLTTIPCLMVEAKNPNSKHVEIQGYPTLIAYRGVSLGEFSGKRNVEELQSWVEELGTK